GGRNSETAVARARRAVAEFRIRGVATNIPFLQAVLDDEVFRGGNVNTSFIEERPHLLTLRSSADRGTKILRYLADVTVNKPHGERTTTVYPHDKLSASDLNAERLAGARWRLRARGPEGVARALRDLKGIGFTYTTFRDARQSLLATRVRCKALMTGVGHVARMTPQLLSIGAGGG